ncbi:NAD(P)-binding protein [Rhizodiscina lignyota]|uniref:NAD(P)-binding protein n=1 Tax=Rhizodiscina lignyota TaxID=1504668 RepID=A0A9P4I0M5_9PEZI|nr:NAD(P)-binding protein [Rhizodiscina lignyota]
MAPTKVLVTGVTGFIGGTILSHLISSQNPTTKNLQISVLTRNDDRAKSFSSANLKVYLIRDLDDTAAITAAASENDIVIHTASGYHTGSAEALTKGLGIRKQQNPNAEVYYIHTSGTSNLADRPISKTYLESRTFSDKDPDVYAYLQKREATEAYPQRTTDIAVVETGKKEGVPTTIIMSPAIYGLVPHPMKSALKEGKAEYVGDGKGVWDFVHVLDLAPLYEIVLLDWVEGRRRVPAGERAILFSGTGSFAWKDVAERISKAGVELGNLKDAETRSVSLAEAARKWVGGDEQLCEPGFASNSRTKAEIGKELGWKPTKTREDWEGSFLDEFREVVKKAEKL